MAYIYKIINHINNKIYVGKTSLSIEERFREHIHDSKNQYKEKRPLYDAMNKYGIKNFTIEMIEKVPNDEIACEREQYWIEQLRTYIGFKDCQGYNATLGGDSRRLYNYREIADKYKELGQVILVAQYYHCDVQTVRKACKECNIKIQSCPKEIRQKIGRQNIKYAQKANQKPVQMIDLHTNEVIKEFDSIKEAASFLGKTYGANISACLIGKTKKAYGYFWRYKKINK